MLKRFTGLILMTFMASSAYGAGQTPKISQWKEATMRSSLRAQKQDIMILKKLLKAGDLEKICRKFKDQEQIGRRPVVDLYFHLQKSDLDHSNISLPSGRVINGMQLTQLVGKANVSQTADAIYCNYEGLRPKGTVETQRFEQQLDQATSAVDELLVIY